MAQDSLSKFLASVEENAAMQYKLINVLNQAFNVINKTNYHPLKAKNIAFTVTGITPFMSAEQSTLLRLEKEYSTALLKASFQRPTQAEFSYILDSSFNNKKSRVANNATIRASLLLHMYYLNEDITIMNAVKELKKQGQKIDETELYTMISETLRPQRELMLNNVGQILLASDSSTDRQAGKAVLEKIKQPDNMNQQQVG